MPHSHLLLLFIASLLLLTHLPTVIGDPGQPATEDKNRDHERCHYHRPPPPPPPDHDHDHDDDDSHSTHPHHSPPGSSPLSVWIPITPIGGGLTPRVFAQGIVLPSRPDAIIVIGGESTSGGQTIYNDIEISIDEGASWNVLGGPTPFKLFGHQALATGNNGDEVLVIGGQTDGQVLNANVWAINDATFPSGGWSLRSSNQFSPARVHHCAVNYKQKVIVFGGMTFFGGATLPLMDTWFSDDDGATFISYPTNWGANGPRYGMSCGTDDIGTIYMVGGSFGLGSDGVEKITNEVWMSYNYGQSWWMLEPPAIFNPRVWAGPIVNQADRLVFAGGYGPGGCLLSDVWFLYKWCSTQGWSRDNSSDTPFVPRYGHITINTCHGLEVLTGTDWNGVETNDVFLLTGGEMCPSSSSTGAPAGDFVSSTGSDNPSQSSTGGDGGDGIDGGDGSSPSSTAQPGDGGDVPSSTASGGDGGDGGAPGSTGPTGAGGDGGDGGDGGSPSSSTGESDGGDGGDGAPGSTGQPDGGDGAPGSTGQPDGGDGGDGGAPSTGQPDGGEPGSTGGDGGDGGDGGQGSTGQPAGGDGGDGGDGSAPGSTGQPDGGDGGDGGQPGSTGNPGDGGDGAPGSTGQPGGDGGDGGDGHAPSSTGQPGDGGAPSTGHGSTGSLVGSIGSTGPHESSTGGQPPHHHSSTGQAISSTGHGSSTAHHQPSTTGGGDATPSSSTGDSSDEKVGPAGYTSTAGFHFPFGSAATSTASQLSFVTIGLCAFATIYFMTL